MSTAVFTHSAFGRRSTVITPTTRPVRRATQRLTSNRDRVRTADAPTIPTAGAPATHLRLTRRGRLAITITVAVPLAVGAVVFAVNGGIAAATVDAGPVDFGYVQVATGESLWQIAQSIAPDADPREVVSDLVHLNQLSTVVVQPGQRLAVPQAYSD